jgi:hypothetical protein
LKLALDESEKFNRIEVRFIRPGEDSQSLSPEIGSVPDMAKLPSSPGTL